MRCLTQYCCALLGLVGFLAGCNFATDDTTPTVEQIDISTIEPLPQQTSTSVLTSPTPSLTPQLSIQVVTLPPTITPVPSLTAVPTETPGPWEYTIQEDDTIGFIIQQEPFNYAYDLHVIETIVALNDNMPNADTLPPVGQIILIPRPTPVSAVLEVTVVATRDRVSSAIVGEIRCHIVEEGESAVSIISQYRGLTLEIFSQINANVNFLGCDFEQPGGGPSCSPFLQAGQCVNVVFPTPTPTQSPTPSGNETPTPTPTFQAPKLISPPQGATATGSVTLQWVSVGILQPDEFYVVQVVDRTNGTVWNAITRLTSHPLPDDLIPRDGQPHQIEWNVFVAKSSGAGQYIPTGEIGTLKGFQWQPG